MGAQTCTEPILESVARATCLLPEGSGAHVPVTATTIEDGALARSHPFRGVSFAPPAITHLEHANCTSLGGNNSRSSVDCPRAGGGKLTLFGANFGSEGASVRRAPDVF